MRLKQDSAIFLVLSIAAAALLSSGLFLLPGIAFAKAGPAASLSYLLAGLLAGAAILSIIELSTASPEPGGDYFFISRGMGPAIGTVSGILNWLAFSLLAAFALAGIGIVAQSIGLADISISGLVAVALVVLINIRKPVGLTSLHIALAASLLALMLIYIIKGIGTLHSDYLKPFTFNGPQAIFASCGFVLISYTGILAIVKNITGQAEPTQWVWRLVTILLLAVVPALFALLALVTVGVLPSSQLSGSLIPLSQGSAAMFGQAGTIAAGIAAVLVFLVTVNAAIASASSYLLALSRDSLIPPVFGKLNPRFQTPYIAILLTALAVIIALFVRFNILVTVASTVFILTFILSSLSVIVLRESDVQNYKPLFKTPLYPWLQISVISGFCFVIFEMGERAFLTSVLTILAGFAIWWFYGRDRVRSESALLYLVKKIVAREFVTGCLEIELKSIIRQRDHIIQDRFDEIIEDSAVLDIRQPMTMEDFFKLVADILAQRHKLSEQKIYDLLMDREKESSTVVSEGLAIPHIVIEGEKIFDILLARAKDGIIFSKPAAPIRTVFVLVGSRDDRNFHLQALSAIAQIVQNENFQIRWISAANERDLRDVVLLAQRRRR